MIGRNLFVTAGLILCLTTGGEAWAGGSKLKRIGQIKVKSGYIDAHFAVSSNGRTLAYVHVGEGKKASYLNLYSLAGTPKRIARVNITKTTVAPVRLLFSPDSGRLVLVYETAGRALAPPRHAVVYDLTGKAVGRIKNFHRLAFKRIKGGWQMVAYLRVIRGQQVTHTVTLYHATTYRRGKVARLRSKRSGEVKKPKMTIAYWTPDYTQAVTKVQGEYNRAADARDPDREKVYDVFTRKFVSDRKIDQLAEWAKIKKIRAANESMINLLRIKGSQKHPVWEMLDKRNTRVKLPSTSPPLKWFSFPTFTQQPTWSDKKVLFSFTVDPQWPTIFGQKRNVAEVFHLFSLNVTSRQSKLLGTIACPKQVLGWRVGGSRLVVVRLHRYWKLGHRSIEIYRIPK